MIAAIILAHQNLPHLSKLAKALASHSIAVFIHLDARSSISPFEVLANIPLEFQSNVHFASRIACRWGDFSLVRATLNCLELIQKLPRTPDHVLLLSGADIPIKPISSLKTFLAKNKDADFIEATHASRKWVSGGFQNERLKYYYYFNFKKSKWLFERSIGLQKFFGIRRRMPVTIDPHFGSQWWSLTWDTCARILRFLHENPKVEAFFRHSWIPDEAMFQTLAVAVSPEKRRYSGLTLYQFDDRGEPLTFYDDHIPVLQRSPKFFARKVSPHATKLIAWSMETSQSECDTLPAPETLNEPFHEYDTYYREKRWGEWDCRRGAKIYDREIGNFEWNRKPFFVIFCDSPLRARLIQQRLNASEYLSCDGYLLDETEVDFRSDIESRAFVSRSDAAWLASAPMWILPEILRSDETRIQGFLADPRRDQSLGVLAQRSAAAIVIVLQSYPDPAPAKESFGSLRPNALLPPQPNGPDQTSYLRESYDVDVAMKRLADQIGTCRLNSFVLRPRNRTEFERDIGEIVNELEFIAARWRSRQTVSSGRDERAFD